MKTILAAVALAAAITSPAFAQSSRPGFGNANVARMHDGGTSAYAWAPSGPRVRTSAAQRDRGLAAFGDATDHLLPGEINEPGPR